MNDTLNKIIDKKELELERFMNLAENVSNKIVFLTFQRKIAFASIAFSVIVCVLSLVFFIYLLNSVESLSDILFVLSLFILIFTFYNVFKSLREIKKINQDIERESYMLGDLLNITDSYKEKRLDHNDAPRKVYFDMRMSRIDFTHAKFKKQAQNTASVQQETTQSKPTESPVSTSV